jgi:hypothetical protein
VHLVRERRIPESRIDESARRLLLELLETEILARVLPTTPDSPQRGAGRPVVLVATELPGDRLSAGVRGPGERLWPPH